MSRFFNPLRFLVAGIAFCFAALSPASAQQRYDDDVYNGTYQQFYDELDPYGDWINDPQYGYVWVPDAGPDFRPYYSNGYWVNSQYGNTWVSNYSWGWAPFHYGRWTYSNYYGWLWVPGNTWGPAWVSWRSGGGAYGWAPMAPGISINIAIGNYAVPDYWWTFTPQQHILSPRWNNYCYGPRYAPQYVRNTTIINNTYVYNNNTYIAGPRRGDMERAIGRPVTQVAINNSTRPMRSEVRGNSVSMFRPSIAQSQRTTERPRTFRTAEQPVAATATHIPRESRTTGFNAGETRQSTFRDRGTAVQQQAIRGDRAIEPARSAEGRVPVNRQEQRQRLDAEMQAPQQRERTFGGRQQVQPAEAVRQPRDWSSAPRMAERAERQQMQQAPQRVERSPFPSRGVEMQRPQPAQRMERPMPAQRMERPMPAQRMERPMPAQRMEQPRTMDAPRRMEPSAPVRMDRPQPSGMEGGRMRR